MSFSLTSVQLDRFPWKITLHVRPLCRLLWRSLGLKKNSYHFHLYLGQSQAKVNNFQITSVVILWNLTKGHLTHTYWAGKVLTVSSDLCHIHEEWSFRLWTEFYYGCFKQSGGVENEVTLFNLRMFYSDYGPPGYGSWGNYFPVLKFMLIEENPSFP